MSSLTPHVLSEPPLTDRFIRVVRAGRPLTTGEITKACYVSARHVHVAGRGLEEGLVDEAPHSTGAPGPLARTCGSRS